jgi:hypothetical protein
MSDPNTNWAMYNPEKANPVDWVGIATKRKEQAEKLAEALRGMVSLVEDLGVTTSTTRDNAEAALAAYESEVGK